ETVKKYSELGERKRVGVSSPVMFLILINIMIFFAGLITEQNSGIDIFKSAGIQDNDIIRDG
ncbi:MAG: hypothetical protein IJZ90_01350, partial [Clostridia bacterium]|nr:hypothetical protein [Clostridia bacterium]